AAVGDVVLTQATQLQPRFRRGAEREQPAAARQKVAETGVLNDCRAPAGHVGRTALAEPSAPGAHVGVLGNRELRSRALYVALVRPGIPRRRSRIANAPPARDQSLMCLIRRGDCNLHALADLPGE